MQNVENFPLFFLLVRLVYLFFICWELIVVLEDKPSEKSKMVSNHGVPVSDHFSLKREHLKSREPPLQTKNNALTDGSKPNTKGVSYSPVGKEVRKSFDNSASDLETRAQTDASSHRNLGNAVKGRKNNGLGEASELTLDAATDPTLPTEVNPQASSLFSFQIHFQIAFKKYVEM